MGYELIKEDGISKVVRFTMDSGDLRKIFRKVKKEISREVNIPGFRPGHVPDSILDKKFGNLIVAEVAEKAHKDLTDGLFDEFDWVLSDEDPEFENLLPVEGEDYSYTVTYKTFETPEPVDYSGIKLEVPSFNLDKAVDETIDHVRKQFVEFDETDKPSEENDLVVLTYPAPEGEENDEPRELSAVIGQNDMGPGFDPLITGVSAGDSFTMQMKVQKEGEEELAGPSHTFTVKEVKAHTFPELDDEFAKKAGGFDNMETFREKVTEDITTRHNAEMKSYQERLVVDKLLASNEFEVPKFMVNNLKTDYLSRLEGDDKDESAVKAAEEMAERKVREFLLLRQIAIKENIEISEQEIAEAVAKGDSRSAFLDRSRNTKALEFVLEKAIIEEKDAKEHESTAGDTNTVPWQWVKVDPEAEKTSEEGAE